MENWVFHIDMDAFFASVSLLSFPEYQGQPLVVAGDPAARHGVVLAKNQEAKMQGIKTAMSLAEARRLVPGLIVLPPEHQKYKDYSQQARAIYRGYSEHVESFGMDECWLDLLTSDPLLAARQIQAEIKDKLRLSVSIGIAKDKVFAKLASDLQKPGGLVWLRPEDTAKRVWLLPIERLLFVGKASADKLHDLGITTIGELARCPEEVLTASLGKIGTWLLEAARGQNRDPVKAADAHEQAKSISSMETLAADIDTIQAAQPVLERQLQDIVHELKAQGLRARSVQIWYKTAQFQSFTRQGTLLQASDQYESLKAVLQKLLHNEVSFKEPIRALGAGLSLLENASFPQQLMLEDWTGAENSIEQVEDLSELPHLSSAKASQIRKVIEDLNASYGKEIIKYKAAKDFVE